MKEMGISKTEIFTEQQNVLANYAKALSHPARIAILQHLMATDACVCGDIVSEIGLAQATVSQHLKELKKAGIIQGTVEGTSVCYCINDDAWKQLSNSLGAFVSKESKQASNCC